MAQPRFYPELSKLVLTNLSAWKQLSETHADYFDNENCPYSHEETKILKSIFVDGRSQEQKEQDLEDELHDDDDVPDLEQESLRLFKDMKKFKRSLSAADTTEMATTFRTMVSLMEKIIDQKERASGIKHFAEFKGFIFDTMERYLTPQQISEFMDDVKTKLQITE